MNWLPLSQLIYNSGTNAMNQNIIDEVSKFLGENINDYHTCVYVYI